MNYLLLKMVGAALCFFILNTDLKGQGINVTIGSQDIHYVGRSYNGIKGNAFLYNDWAIGTAKLQDGTVFEGLKLKYDQLKDEVFFSLEDNRTKTFMHPIQQFTITEPNNNHTIIKRIFRNGYTPIDGATEKSYYEVLQEGNTHLLKRTSKSIVEERAEGQIYKTKQIKAVEKYYLVIENKLIRIKKDKKSVLSALPDKSKAAQLETYIATNKLSFKDESGLAQIIVYYDSLKE